MQDPSPITRLIQQAQSGDPAAADDLYARIYDELRRLAHGVRRGEAAHTLATTALVHEAWIKLASAHEVDVESRIHFRHIAARAMRQVLVDRARARGALKRGGGEAPVTLEESLLGGASIDALQIIDLDDALGRLEAADPRAAKVVECRFFGGMDVEETATALGISPATVKRDWRVARAWLSRALDGPS
ncbi:MAG: sigma-70 family RNA polymerase sigma factor [Gemmatimonadetes bacterium]|nr:sigma-70 family RNA polymerase sigma factor [Gemmatimonadota bacterium]